MRPLDYTAILDDHAVLRDAVLQAPDELFRGQTPAAITLLKGELINELILDTSFKLLTKIEADLRQDYIDTWGNGWTDPLSIRYAALLNRIQKRKRDPERISAGRILDELKLHFGGMRDPFELDCQELQGYFRFRHWYAHGRFLVRMQIVVPLPARVEQLGRRMHLKVVARIH